MSKREASRTPSKAKNPVVSGSTFVESHDDTHVITQEEHSVKPTGRCSRSMLQPLQDRSSLKQMDGF
jgi:hypothetical protein